MTDRNNDERDSMLNSEIKVKFAKTCIVIDGYAAPPSVHIFRPFAFAENVQATCYRINHLTDERDIRTYWTTYESEPRNSYVER